MEHRSTGLPGANRGDIKMVKGKDRVDTWLEESVKKGKRRSVDTSESRKARGDKQVSFFLPPDLIKAFQFRAIDEGKSKSELAEACIRKYLRK